MRPGAFVDAVAETTFGAAFNFYGEGTGPVSGESGSARPPCAIRRVAARVRFATGCYNRASAAAWSAAFLDTHTRMKTWNAKAGEIERRWYLVDAEGQTLGRLATQIADALRGKRKPGYTPHLDTGDFVVVVNAEKIAVTGKKLQDKRYYRHSGYPGGLRVRTLAEELERRPTEVLRKAVKGMLPRNRLARAQLTKLKIYAGPEHPHEAQQPEPLALGTERRTTE